MSTAHYYILYHESTLASGLEWGTKYCVDETGADSGTVGNFASAETILLHTSVEITRWEFFSPAGLLMAQGGLTGKIGTNGGEMMPIHYALLLRLGTDARTKRPSVRYIHGWVEAYQSNGTPSSAFNTDRGNYTDACIAAPSLGVYTDSDGNSVLGHSFRGFSRRKRMRRKNI